MEIEHWHKAHAVGIGDDIVVIISPLISISPRTFAVSATIVFAFIIDHSGVGHCRATLRQPQQVDVRSDFVLMGEQACPCRHRYLPFFTFGPSCTIHGCPGIARLMCFSGLVGDMVGPRSKGAAVGGLFVTVPEETLQHHSAIVGWPSLGKGGQRQEQRHCENKVDFPHNSLILWF